MTELEALDRIKAFLDVEMANNLYPKYLEAATLIPPIIQVGWIEPGNVMDDDSRVPGILVGLDKISDRNDDPTEIGIILKFGIWDPGNDGGSEGYRSLLNIMSQVRTALLSNRDIGGVVVQKPYEANPDAVQAFPCWQGTATFTINLIPTPVTKNPSEISVGLLSKLQLSDKILEEG